MYLPVPASDAELLQSDYGGFYDRYVAGVAAFVGGRVRDPEVCLDLVAETFARALEKRGHYDGHRAPAIAWLLGIARNLMIDAARRGRVEASSRVRLGMSPIEVHDEQLPSVTEFSRRDLSDALAVIPAEQREAVLRRVVLEDPYPVIAVDLRCSEQVVRKRVSRGLSALRANLEGER